MFTTLLAVSLENKKFQPVEKLPFCYYTSPVAKIRCQASWRRIALLHEGRRDRPPGTQGVSGHVRTGRGGDVILVIRDVTLVIR